MRREQDCRSLISGLSIVVIIWNVVLCAVQSSHWRLSFGLSRRRGFIGGADMIERNSHHRDCVCEDEVGFSGRHDSFERERMGSNLKKGFNFGSQNF